MEASVATETQEEGAPSENGAEATRTSAHLFAYSKFVHIGDGAQECEHKEDGRCENAEHWHAWICLPNALQRQDILDKAKAAKARRRRAMRDPEADAYAVLETELDELLAQDREPLLKEMAEREARKGGIERVRELIEGDERFNNYWQDAEELARLKALPEEERPTEELESLEAMSKDFDAALDEQEAAVVKRETEYLGTLSSEEIREKCRQVRIEGESAEMHMRAYYLWMGFICTRVPLRGAAKLHGGGATRVFEKLDDYRSASPEVVQAVEETLRDLEGRFARGDAPGNS